MSTNICEMDWETERFAIAGVNVLPGKLIFVRYDGSELVSDNKLDALTIAWKVVRTQPVDPQASIAAIQLHDTIVAAIAIAWPEGVTV